MLKLLEFGSRADLWKFGVEIEVLAAREGGGGVGWSGEESPSRTPLTTVKRSLSPSDVRE